MSERPLAPLHTGSGHNPEPVIRALAEATSTNFEGDAQRFVTRWAQTLNAEVEWRPAPTPLLHFRTRLHSMYLRGFEVVSCWLLPGNFDAARFFAPGGDGLRLCFGAAEEIPVIICPGTALEAQVRGALPKNRAVILGPAAISAILNPNASKSRSALRQAIRAEIHLLRIQPFDTTRPVSGDMFVGRTRELNLLLHSQEFLLFTGPSRIGKSSVLAQYNHILTTERRPRRLNSFHMSLQSCSNASDDEIARFIAMNFRAVTAASTNITVRELRSFLFGVVASLGPIELIVDEADAICHSEMLLLLGDFAQNSGSRLIIIGRGAVRRFWQRHRASAFGRIREVRFQPLSPEEAWQLFSAPLEALGITLVEPDTLKAQVLQETSRMAHLVQATARAAVETVQAAGTSQLSASLLRRGHDTFADSSTLRSHLDDLSSPLARLVAALVLLSPGQTIGTAPAIQAALAKEGILLTASQTADVCDDLVINCLLGWENDGYTTSRWDICQAARRHTWLLEASRDESLAQLGHIRK